MAKGAGPAVGADKERTESTLADCAAALGWETSTMCINSVDDSISSSVAWKAAMSCVGSFCAPPSKASWTLAQGSHGRGGLRARRRPALTWMKPTVSVSSTSLPDGSVSRRVVGSSVAKSLSSASTPAAVRRLSSVLLPGPPRAPLGAGGRAAAALRASHARARLRWCTPRAR